MTSNSGFVNDGSQQAPRLSVYLNLDNLVDLRADSAWPCLEGLPHYEKLFGLSGYAAGMMAARRMPGRMRLIPLTILR